MTNANNTDTLGQEFASSNAIDTNSDSQQSNAPTTNVAVVDTISTQNMEVTGPVITISGAEAVESSSNYVRFVVTLSEPSASAVTFNYRTLLTGSAEDNDIYYGASSSQTNGSVTIAPGDTSAQIFILLASDTVDEDDENFELELYNLQGASFENGALTTSAQGVILDDDGPNPNDAIIVSDPVLVEGDSGSHVARFEVRLSRPATATTSLDYTTVDGGAEAGVDYDAASGTLIFAAGQDVAFVDVVVHGDTAIESDETFDLVVTPPNPTLLNTDSAVGTATILDDDAALAGPVVTISGGEAIESSSNYVRFVVTLTEPSASAVTFNYRTLLTGSAEDNDIYYGASSSQTNGSVTIAPGDTSANIYILLATDNVDEDDEDFELELFNLQGAAFENGEQTISAKGVILDDDGANPNDAIIVSDPVLVEEDSGSQIARFEVRLSRPATTTTTLDYTTVDGGATAGLDYDAVSGSLTFEAGQKVAFVDVVVYGDTAIESDETFDLVVTPPNANILNTDSAAGTATILDDDAAFSGPMVTISGGEAIESSSNYVRFVVTLTEPSVSAVTFDYRTVLTGTAQDNDIYYGASSSQTNGSVTIAPGDTSANIFILLATDSVDELDEDFELELYNLQGATFENGEQTTSAKGIILDDDGANPNVVLMVDDQVLAEGSGSNVIYDVTVDLSRVASEETIFDVSLNGASASVPGDIRLLTDTITFMAGQSSAVVQVEVAADAIDEQSEFADLSFQFVSGMAMGDVENALIQIDNTTPPATSGFTPNDDVADLTSSSDDVDALAGDDVVNAFGGDDIVRGSEGNDILAGGSGNDELYGGDDNDTLSGGRNSDLLNGDDGDDMVNGNEGVDTISGGAGLDTLFGNAGSDFIFGGSDADYIDGGQGFDEIHGDDGDDTIEGKDGEDLIFGGAGDDTIFGNAGSDEIHGGDDDDTIDGGQGADVMYGDAGVDTITGLGGADTLFGGSGSDQLFGNSGSDTISGDDGDDDIYGGQAGDVLNGGVGNDTLNGDNGGDTLLGDEGDDILYGNAGADILNGGAGDDILNGGKSTDTFIFTEGNDRIDDFNANYDTIQIDGDPYGLTDTQDVLDLADTVNGNTVFDFGGGNTLTVADETDLDVFITSLTVI